MARLLGLGTLIGVAYLAGVCTIAARAHGNAERPGTVDIGFAQDMALHHDQAVTMSLLVRDRASPHIRALADVIATNQLVEIGQMKGWLALWRQPQVPTTRQRVWMVPRPGSRSYDPAYADLCRGAPGGMPGLASVAQLQALRQASGPALDRLYLQLMVRHHEGGAPMLRYGAEHAESEQVRQAAARMAYEQRHEAAQLISLLAMASQAGPAPR